MGRSSQPPSPPWTQRETALPTAFPAQPGWGWPRGTFDLRWSVRWTMTPCRRALLFVGLPTCLPPSEVDPLTRRLSSHWPPNCNPAPNPAFCSRPGIAWNLISDSPSHHQAPGCAGHSLLFNGSCQVNTYHCVGTFVTVPTATPITEHLL